MSDLALAIVVGFGTVGAWWTYGDRIRAYRNRRFQESREIRR